MLAFARNNVQLTRLFLLRSCYVLLLLNSIIRPAAGLSTSAATVPPKFAILGGTGKIGTAVATHLLQRSPGCKIVLVGRRASSGGAAIQEIESALRPKTDRTISPSQISFHQVDDIWQYNSNNELTQWFLDECISGVVHTAGPYANEHPTVLDAAISARVPVYVDVSDPLPFLEASLERHKAAVAAGTTALCAAGAFPGMSNVLAMEAAGVDSLDSTDNGIQDVRFHYFTKGLGGSGTVNLYITNIGFGDAMTQFDQGQRRAFRELSGQLLGTVDFFIPSSSSITQKQQHDNKQAERRVGTQQVFAWPFPEAATVPTALNAKGSSSAAMGTAPDLWNVMLGLLVQLVPRPWWRSQRFSQFMADFSQPLVLLTDALLKQQTMSTEDDDNAGETHAMRIDVTKTSAQNTESIITMTSIVQAHESFRSCVGQSCAEFALDLWENPAPTGVFLPEQRYQKASDRTRIIQKLTTTPGTFCYTGPVDIVVPVGGDTNGNSGSNQVLPVYPTKIHSAVEKAKEAEMK